ncbi:MAG: M24 family metallopeptidase [bacterium]|nr:M24 family metallopeptidase [bacterium]
MNELLQHLKTDYLLVNSTNKYLVEYSELSENARYTLTGFSGSTGDALITPLGVFLFVDGRYHTQADMEAKDGVNVVKLSIGQSQDEEIAKHIENNSTFTIVATKVSQSRLEKFKKLLEDKNVKFQLIDFDPINNYTEQHDSKNIEKVNYLPKTYTPTMPTYITNLEEVSYLTGRRDFSKDYTSKVWGKLFIDGKNPPLLFASDKTAKEFLMNYEGEIQVDKNSINAYEYSLIKNPVHKVSEIKELKSVKTDEEIELYKKAFEATDKAISAIRKFIEDNENLSEYDISEQLHKEFLKYGAKLLSFKSIVAINQNSALAHYSKASKDVILKNGDLVLIDCGAYYKSGLATDITRVFVKGEGTDLQKKVYTTVLKTFLNCYNSTFNTGYEIDSLAHSILDNNIEGFSFSHGLGHGIGINVHEAPPALNKTEIAHTEFLDNMTYTIEPGLYNPEYFGVRLENSCYRKNGKNCSFVKIGFEGKLIDYSLLTEQEQLWLKEFEIL